MGIWFKGAGTFLAALFAMTLTAGAAEMDADLFRQGLEHALESPRNFTGNSSQDFKGAAGPNCDYRSRLKLAWNGEVQKVQVDLDAQGNTSVLLLLSASHLKVEGLGRDGWLCRWLGSRGTVGLGQVSLRFKLLPLSHGHTPDVSFDQLTFSEIHFSDFKLGGPGLGWIGGNPPVWLERWVESHLNDVLLKLLSSELKTRLDVYLTRELAKRLEDYGNAPLSAPSMPAFGVY